MLFGRRLNPLGFCGVGGVWVGLLGGLEPLYLFTGGWGGRFYVLVAVSLLLLVFGKTLAWLPLKTFPCWLVFLDVFRLEVVRVG